MKQQEAPPAVVERDRYWTDMGRSIAPPTPTEVAARASVLSYQLRRVLPRISRGTVCDAGCGRGENLLAMQSMGFAHVRGCDLGAPQVAAARAAGADVACADALEWLDSVRDASCVMAFDVLEHMPAAAGDALIAAALRAIEPGGWMLLQFPNCASPFGGAVQWADPTHIRALTPELVSVRARAAGFATTEALEVGPVPHSVLGAVRTVAWAALRTGMRAWDAIETGRTASRPYTRVCIVAAQKAAA